MTPSDIATLVASMKAAAHAYHNGLTLLMTDAEYDAALDKLAAADPTNPFLEQVGAPPATGDEVLLPIPLPSLSKIKAADDTLAKWLARNPAKHYHVSNKLDGCSALWIPATRKLYTRGDGVKGRDISHLAQYFTGFPPAAGSSAGAVGDNAVRGELIMYAASPAIPADKIARNVVAGALNRKEVDTELFAEIRFVAYELIVEAPQQPSPMDSTKLLYAAGYETAHVVLIPATKMNETYLSALFTHSEAASRYQIDGVVVAPNLPRAAQPRLRKGQALNPTDCVAWKTRQVATTVRTTVRSVEWNISMTGYLIPRVLFDPVVLSGATISAATGLHGRWIYENKVGPGASIEIRRAGDVIPQIIAIHTAAPAGPSMPPIGGWQWMGAAETAVHIGPTAATDPAAANKARLSHALAELGAENVGPGIVAKLYAAGFTTLKAIYAASVSELAARVEGVKAAAAERIWNGLRAKQGTWTEVTLMYASCTMPRGVGHSKLTPLLTMNPDPATWSAATFKASRPAGLSDKTIDEIVAAVPGYLAWRLDSAPLVQQAPQAPVVAPAPAAVAPAPAPSGKVIVFTGGRDKALEAALQAAGHQVADAVTKKTTHIAYPDGPEPSSTKITKAREMGIAILSASALRAEFHIAH